MPGFYYHYNSYLSKCDIINKYNSKSPNVSKLVSIILDLPLNQILSLLGSSYKSKNYISKTQIKSFFLLYLSFNLKPFFKFKLNKKNEKIYSLQIKITNKREVTLFIYHLYISLISNQIFKNNLTFNKISQKKISFVKCFPSIMNLKLPIFFLPNLNVLLDIFFRSIESKMLFFYTNFLFSPVEIRYKYYIQNIFCIWFFLNRSTIN
jgi:hypothetical protein